MHLSQSCESLFSENCLKFISVTFAHSFSHSKWQLNSHGLSFWNNQKSHNRSGLHRGYGRFSFFFFNKMSTTQSRILHYFGAIRRQSLAVDNSFWYAASLLSKRPHSMNHIQKSWIDNMSTCTFWLPSLKALSQRKSPSFLLSRIRKSRLLR